MDTLKKIWNFIWHDDSFLSWIVNVVLAIILVKFIIYPGLGLILGTTHPLVAVVSSSMEHNNLKFDDWWSKNGQWYESNSITKEQFNDFLFKNGFNKGDIMILWRAKNPKVGDVIVYPRENSNSPPVIHRVVEINELTLKTKGDNVDRIQQFEDNIQKNSVIGKAIIRIPLLGYIKIWFVDLIMNPIMQIFK